MYEFDWHWYMPRVVLETVSFSCCLVVSRRRSYWEKNEFSHEGSDTVIIALKDYSPSAIFNTPHWRRIAEMISSIVAGPSTR